MDWLFLAAWVLASGGVAKLLAIAENIVHGWGISRPTLQKIRGVHNVCLVGYPLLLMGSQGLAGPALLWTGAWSSTGPFGGSLWALGGLGLVVLTASTIRYWQYQPPACQTSATSRVIDIAARTAESLVGTGRARWLAALPGNEQFTLEIEERIYTLPRLPAAWDGLSIVHFSDLHFRGPVTRRYFEEVIAEAAALEGDIVVFTGDLLDDCECLSWVDTTLAKLSAPLGCYFVLGNHDWYLPTLLEMRRKLTAHGWTDLSSRTMVLERDSQALILGGTERPWMGTAPDFSPYPPEAFRILLSHGPDQIGFARRQHVDLMLAGHTHGGQIRLPILGPVYCPSVYGTRYASGVFWEPPTLMLVSRGVSGREPMRYNCRPELTKLTLRCPPSL